MAMTVEQRTIRNARIRARYTYRRDELNAAERAKRDQLKRKLLQVKGGRCEICLRSLLDFNGHVAAYDFHHVDPAAKSYCISNCYTRSWSSLISELRLTQLLCRCCHAIETSRMRAEDTRRRGRPPFYLRDQSPIADARLAALDASTFHAELRRMHAAETARRTQPDLFGGMA